MRANQMGDAIKVLLESGGITNKVLNSRELSLFINMAITEFVNTRVFNNRNIRGEGIEDSNKRILDIAPLFANRTGVYMKKRVVSNTTYGDFVRGTYVNGALRTNDLDTELSNSVPGGDYDTAILTDAEDAKYGVLVELPDEVLFIISQNCDISMGSDINKVWRNNVTVKHIKHEEYNEMIWNSYRTPYTDLVWCTEFGNSLPLQVVTSGRNTVEFRSSASSRTNPSQTLLTPEYKFDGTQSRILQLIPPKGFEIEKYNVYYVRKPVEVLIDYTLPSNQVDCDLHPSVHSEIVQIAARIAIASLIPTQQKYQIAQVEAKTNE